MATNFTASFNRSGAADRTAREIPEEVVNTIIADAEQSSVALQLGNVRRMNAFQTRLRLLNSLPDAYWINGTTTAGDAPLGSANLDDTNQAAKDSGLKQTTKFGWDNVYLTPDELAVLVVMPDAWRDDSDIADEEIRAALRTAFAKAIDKAIFFGDSTTSHPIPSTFGPGVVPEAVTAGNTVDLSAHLALTPTDGTRADRADAYAALAAQLSANGYDVTNFVVAPGETWNLRRQRDENGALLNAGQLFGLGVSEVKNGTWDAAQAIALGGDFQQLHIGIRQDMTFSVSNSAVITNAAGTAVYNAYQQDGEVLRAVMRVGYAITNPLKHLTGAREFPFSVLVP